MFFNKSFAIKTSIFISISVLVFHFLVLLGVFPDTIVWGGNIKTKSQLYIMESVSILINLFMLFILLMKGNYIKQYFSEKSINTIIAIFAILFVLNTVGNLMAKTTTETIIFTPITAISAVLYIWILLPGKKRNTN